MKKIALISSFCDTEEKNSVLSRNIQKVKKLGLDALLISPIILPDDILKSVDYFFLTKDNPVLEWPEKAIYYWKEESHQGKKYHMTRTMGDYGWASLVQIKQISEIALNLGYDYFYHMIYDLEITPEVEDFFNREYDNLLFPSVRGGTKWEVGLHLMIFNKEWLNRFKNLITRESYNVFKDTHVFDWLLEVSKILPCNISNLPVKDEIYYLEGKDLYNFSPFGSFNFFLVKNDQTNESIKILFYGIEGEIKIQISVEEKDMDFVAENYSIFDLEYSKFNIKETKIFFNDQVEDITDIIRGIKHTTLNIH